MATSCKIHQGLSFLDLSDGNNLPACGSREITGQPTKSLPRVLAMCKPSSELRSYPIRFQQRLSEEPATCIHWLGDQFLTFLSMRSCHRNAALASVPDVAKVQLPNETYIFRRLGEIAKLVFTSPLFRYICNFETSSSGSCLGFACAVTDTLME